MNINTHTDSFFCLHLVCQLAFIRIPIKLMAVPFVSVAKLVSLCLTRQVVSTNQFQMDGFSGRCKIETLDLTSGSTHVPHFHKTMYASLHPDPGVKNLLEL